MDNFNTLKKKALERFFNGLNDMQLKAVFKTDGPLLILAGAGSGKTTVLINRIANMIYFGSAYNYEDEGQHTAEELDFLRLYADGGSDDSQRLAQMIAHYPVKPWNILAITFTNKAASELKERLIAKLGEEGASIAASTFHSACTRILRRECAALGYTSAFTIYDTDDSLRLIKAVLKELDIPEKIFPPRMLLSVISSQKNIMVSPQKYLEENKDNYREREIARVYALYNEKLRVANAMDFDDILLNTVRLFEENDAVLTHYQNLYKYILVDEYQDTNRVQFRLIEMLSARHGNLCVVGDDDQSIYKFRGADISNILSFEQVFDCDPNTDVIRLEQNYRSTQNILSAANKLIKNNSQRKDKTLWTSEGDGEPVTEFCAASERGEAAFIAKTIAENVSNGQKYSSHAVLYRMNAQSNIIEQTLTRSGIPYIVYGGLKFYDRKEIKDVLAYLSVINNPHDILRLRRIVNEPKRGIGEATSSAIEQIASDLKTDPLSVMRESDAYAPIAKKSKILKAVCAIFDELIELSEVLPPSELLDKTLELTGYSDSLLSQGDEGRTRLENISELKSTMIDHEQNSDDPTLSGFLEEISLFTDIDRFDPDSDHVSLMTIHSAKGLEFDNVFVAGMEETIFPSSRSASDPDETEEERRLAYVSITRARKKLYLLHSQTRMLYGRISENRPSRFLDEMPEEIIEKITEDIPAPRTAAAKPKRPDYSHEASDMLDRRRSSLSQNSETGQFRAGDVIMHPNPRFGRGVILSCEPMGGDLMLEIAFDSCGTKKIMANFVKLKKL